MNAPPPPPLAPAKNYSSQATTGLVIGIIALCTWLLPLAGVLIAIIGLIFSCIGLKSTRPGRAVSGLALSSLGLLLAGIVTFVFVINVFPLLLKMSDNMPSTADQAAGAAVQHTLVKGAPFPDFSFTDVEGTMRTLSDYKGKVVLVDFWATWCGPCNEEIPAVKAAYDKYHAQGFEVLGISLELGDKNNFTAFLRDHDLPWPQFYDDNGWSSALALKYGVQYIPQTFLLDRHGNILRKNPSAQELSSAVAAALQAP